MKQKQLIAEHRIFRLDLWLARQPLNPAFNRTLEQAQEFKRRLVQWAENDAPDEIAPTFHAFAGVC